MCRYPLGDAIGWTLDCAQGCAQEEPGSITNSSIIPRLRPTMKRRTRCSPFLPIPHSPQLVQTQPADIIEAPAVPALSSDTSMFDCLPQLFSDHEPRRSPSPQLSPSDDPPELFPSGTSAPLLTHPSLTNYLSNYPLWPNHTKDTRAPTSRPPTPSADQAPPPLPKPLTAPSVKRGRGDFGKRQGRQGHPVHVNLRKR